MKEKTIEVPLEMLVEDWKERATWGPQEEKIKYLNNMHALTEELARGAFEVRAYKTGERYHYSLVVNGREE